MDSKTLEALKGSIEKWKAIEAGTGYDDGSDNCPLCGLFADVCGEPDEARNYSDGCYGCPVAARAGLIGCENTPYMEWLEHVSRNTPRVATTNGAKEAARAEREFLESLLPEVTP